jgi:hypothetical protein
VGPIDRVGPKFTLNVDVEEATRVSETSFDRRPGTFDNGLASQANGVCVDNATVRSTIRWQRSVGSVGHASDKAVAVNVQVLNL